MHAEGESDLFWFGNNGYNLKPPPPHTKGHPFTTKCAKCEGRFHAGVEGSTTCRGKGVNMKTCKACTVKMLGPSCLPNLE
jgi:hypothetical protein